jgi:hypothetical protein
MDTGHAPHGLWCESLNDFAAVSFEGLETPLERVGKHLIQSGFKVRPKKDGRKISEPLSDLG